MSGTLSAGYKLVEAAIQNGETIGSPKFNISVMLNSGQVITGAADRPDYTVLIMKVAEYQFTPSKPTSHKLLDIHIDLGAVVAAWYQP